ncbi:hypothetical protein JOM56_005457 [Amanita muscaria]
MQDLKALVRVLQDQLKELPHLLDRAESMTLAEAEALSNKLSASARDLTTVAGALVVNSARNFVSCTCMKGPPTPTLASPCSQEVEDSLSGSLPPFPFTQILNDAGFQGNLDDLIRLPLHSPHTTQAEAEMHTDHQRKPEDMRTSSPSIVLSTNDRYPFMSTIIADDTVDHADFLLGNLRSTTPDMGRPQTCDMRDTISILGELVLCWDKINFVYETAEALLDTDNPMTTLKKRELSRECVNMALLSSGLLSCILQRTNIMESDRFDHFDAEILQYTRSALRRLISIDEILDFINAATERTLVMDQSEELKDMPKIEQESYV